MYRCTKNTYKRVYIYFKYLIFDRKVHIKERRRLYLYQPLKILTFRAPGKVAEDQRLFR